MNLKRFCICICLAAAVLFLSGCSQEFGSAYDCGSFDSGELLSDEICGIRAKGFASDLCVPEFSGEKNSENVNAEAFALFDTDTLEVVSQKNIYEKVYPASTTKILTCLLALELCDPEEYVTVPGESKIEISGSSMADLKVGDRMKMKDMLYALMVPSGNDAAAAIAVHIGGSVEGFAEMMNRRAEELGAVRSHFTNPHGLPDEDHYTCVYDLYLIFNEALKHPEFMEISSAKEKTVLIRNSLDLTEREVTWTSGNGFYSGKFSLPAGLTCNSGKTGHTNAAGFCLVLGELTESGSQCISIIMKAPLYEDLYNGMVRLTGKIFL